MSKFSEQLKEFSGALKVLRKSRPADFRNGERIFGVSAASIGLVLIFFSLLVMLFTFIRII